MKIRFYQLNKKAAWAVAAGLLFAGAGMLWAVPMSGTYKSNWTTGNTLTAADLNTNFQTIQNTFAGITSLPACGTPGNIVKWDGLAWSCQPETSSPWTADINGLGYVAGNVGIGMPPSAFDSLSVAGNITSTSLVVSGATIDAVGSLSAISGTFSGSLAAFDLTIMNSVAISNILNSPAAVFNDVAVTNNVDVTGSILLGGICHAGVCTSDARLKRDIVPFGNSLDIISALHPVYFRWRTNEYPEYHFHNGRESGLLAQDVEKVLPHLVRSDDHGNKAIFYDKELQMHMVRAIQELKAENDELKKRLAALEARLK